MTPAHLSDAGVAGTTPRADNSDARAARREQLLDAASRAIGAHGPHVSMAAIAAEAGITKPILYRHFVDKGGLFRALAERQTEELFAGIRAAVATTGDVRQRAVATIDAYLTSIEKRPDVYRFVVDRASSEEPTVAGYVASFQKRLAEDLAVVIRRDLGVPQTRAKAWAHGIVGMVRQAGDWWLEERSVSRARLVNELVELLFGGLAVEPAGEQAAEADGEQEAPPRESRSLRSVSGSRRAARE